MPKHTTGETAKLLGVSLITIKRWIYKGKIQAEWDASGKWLIDDKEVLRLKNEMAKMPREFMEKVLKVIKEKEVAYLRELQVWFEDYSRPEDTNKVVHNLLHDGLIKTVQEWERRWVFPADKDWSNVSKIAKEKADLIDFYGHKNEFEENGVHYDDYAEYLVEKALIQVGFIVVAKNTRYFNGIQYRKNNGAGRPPDLDFIAHLHEKNVYVGISIKNRLERPKINHINFLIDICKSLGIRPVIIARTLHPSTFKDLKDNKGFAIMFKRYFKPHPFPPDKFNQILSMGIPIAVYTRPPDFLIKRIDSMKDAL